MIDSVISKNGVRIRLPAERWLHITDEHCELAGLREEVLETVERPDMILEGKQGELLAIRTFQTAGKFLVVPYRELAEDGFVITAFITKRFEALEKRRRLWPL